MKKFKEYMDYVGGVRLGNPSDNITPIASLGDVPPKDQGGKDSRGVGLHDNDKNPNDKDSKQIQKKNIKKEDGMVGPGMGTYQPIGSVSTDKRLKKEDTNRIPRKPGQKAGSDKHSDLYTDENPKGTIHGLGFTDAETATTSVNKIKNSGKSHAHKIQAAIAMSQRAKVASERAKDPKKKKDLGAAHRIYQSFIDTNKKKD